MTEKRKKKKKRNEHHTKRAGGECFSATARPPMVLIVIDVIIVCAGPGAGPSGRLRDRDDEQRGRGYQRVAQVQVVRVVGLLGRRPVVGQHAACQHLGRTALGPAARHRRRPRQRVRVHRRGTVLKT